jgi:hypothetical protein
MTRAPGWKGQPPEQLARKLLSSTANVGTIGQVTPAIPEQGKKVGSINDLIITLDHSLWYEVLIEAQCLRTVYGPGLRLGTR